MLWLLLACGAGGPDKVLQPSTSSAVVSDSGSSAPTTPTTPTTPSTEPTLDTGDTAGTTKTIDPGVITGTCEPDADNVLRQWCALQLEPASAVNLTLTGPDGLGRSFRSDVVASDHLVPVFLMTPETTYTWEATSDSEAVPASGTLVTGTLPVTLDLVVENVREPGARSDHILAKFGCGRGTMAVIFDGDGRVVWYQDMATDGGVLANAVRMTEADTVVALLDRDRIVEVALDGTFIMDAAKGGRGFDLAVHHDLWGNGRTVWVLGAEEVVGDDGRDYIVDSVLLVNGSGVQVGRWDLTSWVMPTGGPTVALGGYWGGTFPLGIDWSHGNSVQPGPDGTMLVSLRHLHTVLAVHLDPLDPSFGTVAWQLTAPDSVLDEGLVLSAAPDFAGPVDFQLQHHATVDDRGRVLVYDNRSGGPIFTRVIAIEVDADAGTATWVHAWDLGTFCAVQGAGYPLGEDHILATCASKTLMWEMGPDSETLRTLEPVCVSHSNPSVERFVPWTPPEVFTVSE